MGPSLRSLTTLEKDFSCKGGLRAPIGESVGFWCVGVKLGLWGLGFRCEGGKIGFSGVDSGGRESREVVAIPAAALAGEGTSGGNSSSAIVESRGGSVEGGAV